MNLKGLNLFNCLCIVYVCLMTGCTLSAALADYIDDEIHGYHFHTYFFQNNVNNTEEAMNFRNAIQERIDSGILADCRLNQVNTEPRGPHPIGSYETCCNKTSASQALSWFMFNHGNLSILLHPLTRLEVLDHSDRSMFLGARLPLDLSVLSEDLEDRVDLCLPLQTKTEESITGNYIYASSVSDSEISEGQDYIREPVSANAPESLRKLGYKLVQD